MKYFINLVHQQIVKSHLKVHDDLKGLNQYVEILEAHRIKKVDIVIQTNLVLHTFGISELCRDCNIKYILCLNVGFTGYIFNDFIKHLVVDPDGEKKRTCFVSNISCLTLLSISDFCFLSIFTNLIIYIIFMLILYL